MADIDDFLGMNGPCNDVGIIPTGYAGIDTMLAVALILRMKTDFDETQPVISQQKTRDRLGGMIEELAGIMTDYSKAAAEERSQPKE